MDAYKIRFAVASAWLLERNAKKIIDRDLTEDIINNVINTLHNKDEKILKEIINDWLGRVGAEEMGILPKRTKEEHIDDLVKSVSDFIDGDKVK